MVKQTLGFTDVSLFMLVPVPYRKGVAQFRVFLPYTLTLSTDIFRQHVIYVYHSSSYVLNDCLFSFVLIFFVIAQKHVKLVNFGPILGS